MAKINKQQVTIILVVIAVMVVVLFQLKLFSKAVSIDPLTARAKGDPQAKVKITEFIDFECPACAHGSKILSEQFEKHGKDMYVQVKYFPLTNMHRHAIQAALYSECSARQGKFWALHEQMMPQQQQWSQLVSADPVFQGIAKDAGVDITKLNTCLASDEARKAINDERAVGQSMGVQSTPSYFINGKMVVGTKSLMDELVVYFPEEKVNEVKAK